MNSIGQQGLCREYLLSCFSYESQRSWLVNYREAYSFIMEIDDDDFYLLFLQSELVNNLLGSDLITGKSLEPHLTPPTFASNPPIFLVATDSHGTPSSNLPSTTEKETDALADSTSTYFNVSYTSGNRSCTSTISSSNIVGIDGVVSISLQPALTIDPYFT